MNSIDRFKNIMLIVQHLVVSKENGKITCVTALTTYLSPVYPAQPTLFASQLTAQSASPRLICRHMGQTKIQNEEKTVWVLKERRHARHPNRQRTRQQDQKEKIE